MLQPGPRQAIERVEATRGKLIVNLYEDVKGAVDVYTWAKGRWSSKRLPLPKNASIWINAASSGHEQLFVESESFLEPSTLWQVDAASLNGEEGQDAAGALPGIHPQGRSVLDEVQGRHPGALLRRAAQGARSPRRPPRPSCTATAASRWPSRPCTCPRWASCGWSRAASTSSPTSAEVASSAPGGTSRCCARTARSRSMTSPPSSAISSAGRSARRAASASTGAPTAACSPACR